MKIVKAIITTVTIGLLSVPAVAQPKAMLFSTDQLQQDYALFVTALKEAHPGLYRYTTPSTFDSLFQQTQKAIDREMSGESFYRLLAPLVAQIKCGHTKWHRKGKPDDRFPFHSEGLLPLQLHFMDQKAYVVNAYSSLITIKPGAEILTINGKSISAILQELRRYITIDGYIESAFYEELNQFFNGYYATFQETSPLFSITYKEGNKRQTAILPATSLAVIEESRQSLKPVVSSPLRLQFPKQDVAILTIERFYTKPNEPNYQRFIDSTFKLLKDRQVKSLVIDLRNNEGGIEEWGGYLYAYLADKDFRYYDKIKVAQKKEFSFRKYAWLPEQYDMARPLIQEKEGEFLWLRQEYLQTQAPRPNAFKGKTYILINGRSFSVTSEFAAVAHYNKRAVFIGEETGGAYSGDNSGVFTSVTLPNTNLTIGIPLFAFYMNVADLTKGSGIVPDHEIKPTIQDILKKRDAVMEYTLKYVNHHN